MKCKEFLLSFLSGSLWSEVLESLRGPLQDSGGCSGQRSALQAAAARALDGRLLDSWAGVSSPARTSFSLRSGNKDSQSLEERNPSVKRSSAGEAPRPGRTQALPVRRSKKNTWGPGGQGLGRGRTLLGKAAAGNLSPFSGDTPLLLPPGLLTRFTSQLGWVSSTQPTQRARVTRGASQTPWVGPEQAERVCGVVASVSAEWALGSGGQRNHGTLQHRAYTKMCLLFI